MCIRDRAETAAENVINSGYFHLMEDRFGEKAKANGDVFSDLFVENNQNRTSGNMESIWVMQFEYNTTGGGTNSDDWTRRAWEPKYFEITGFVLADSLGGRGLSQLVPMKWWIGEDTGFFDEEDIRNSEYNIKRNWYYNNENMPDLYGKKATITDETWFTTFRLYPALTKFFYGRSENLSLTGSYRDRMKFRLSETYLLLCEARLGLNDISGAREAINVVPVSYTHLDVYKRQVIDHYDNNEKLGIGFEAKVKKGSLLVLAVDTQKNINERPATQQLLESIDRYVKSDKFAPQITVDESYIESFLKK